MGVGLPRLPLDRPLRHLAEDADDMPAARQADPADLTIEPLAVRADDHHPARICGDLVSDDLLREHLPPPPAIFGGQDRGELAAAAIADESPCGGVHPADDPGR